jgi:ketosteroid isomerase-like protein
MARTEAEVADADDIRAVLAAYGAALDRRDTEGIVACFTLDVRLEYFHGDVVTEGIDAARGFFGFERPAPVPGIDEVVALTHVWNIGAIAIDAGAAHASTDCIAHLLGRSGDEHVLLTRGLRYEDDLRRTADGWRISVRRHLPQWETRSPATRLSR